METCRHEVSSVMTSPLEIDVPAQGNLLRSHGDRFENLPDDMKVIQTDETAGFMKKELSWTLLRDSP